MSRTAIAIAAALTGLAGAASSWAATPLSVRDSWRIGNAGTSFCSAQSLTVDKALTGMFDAGYSITCRDAALPVGKLYKIKASAGDCLVHGRTSRQEWNKLDLDPVGLELLIEDSLVERPHVRPSRRGLIANRRRIADPHGVILIRCRGCRRSRSSRRRCR